METANKKRRMFFRGMEKVRLCSRNDPLRALVYLAEMDKYEQFRPKKNDLYRTNETRVKVFSRLGLKGRAIRCAKIFSREEDTFRAHEMFVKTLLHFHKFEEAIAEARSFTEKHISKKYENLLAMALDTDFEQEKARRDMMEEVSFAESAKGKLRTLYHWIMTSTTVIRTRVWIDLHLFRMRKKYNRWRHWFTKRPSFMRCPKSEEPSTDPPSVQES